MVATGEKIPPLANPSAGKPAGGISRLDIENALRFDNKLMVFDTTAAGLKAILEHGVASLGNQGRFPQLGGVAFAYDPALPAGARIRSIGLEDESGRLLAKVVENGAVSAEAPALIRLVTLSFLAQGGDGYPMKANGESFRYLLADGTLSAPVSEALDFTGAAAAASVGVTLADILGEQQAFRAFLQARHATPETAYGVAETPLAADTRIQNLAARADTVLDGLALAGTNGAETLEGSAAADTLIGLGGDDLLLGRAEADRLAGGNGADTLDGGAGADTMAGGLNSDVYVLDDAGDVVIEGAGGGFDRVLSSLAHTVLAAHVEALDLLAGAASATGNATGNLLIGNGGANTLDGAAGADTLLGGDGEDLLIGGDGADLLAGGAGADTLVGGNAADTLIGGEGADIFLFRLRSDSYGPGPRRDVIEGFQRGEDRIRLDLDAHPGLAGVQDFVFAAGPVAGNNTGRVWVESPGTEEVLVLASINGNAAAEFSLLVRGVAMLDAADFIL